MHKAKPCRKEILLSSGLNEFCLSMDQATILFSFWFVPNKILCLTILPQICSLTCLHTGGVPEPSPYQSLHLQSKSEAVYSSCSAVSAGVCKEAFPPASILSSLHRRRGELHGTRPSSILLGWSLHMGEPQTASPSFPLGSTLLTLADRAKLKMGPL